MKNPNGYGSVVKLGGRRRKPFAVRITDRWEINKKTGEARQVFKYVGYHESRPEAMIALAEYNKNPYDIDARKTTFSELYELWFKQRFKGDNNKNTILSYETAYKNTSNLHNTPFRNLKTLHMQDVIDNSGLKVSSNKNLKKLFNQISKFAIQNDLAEKNYATYLTIPSNDDPSKRKPFTEEEIELLWKNTDNQIVELALIMIYTGMRPGELLTIKKENIYIEERYLIGGIKTNAGINRTIPLNKKIIPFIKKRLDNERKHLFLNETNDKLNYSTFLWHWKKEMKKLGLDHDPHNSRHTCRTLLNNVEANHVSVDRIMGHASQSIGDRVYTHKDLNQLLKAIDLI